MNIRTDILLRAYISFGVMVVIALAIIYQMFVVQFVNGPKWIAMADSLTTRYATVEAARGNIYSVDGSLLATSVPEYDIRMDRSEEHTSEIKSLMRISYAVFCLKKKNNLHTL